MLTSHGGGRIEEVFVFVDGARHRASSRNFLGRLFNFVFSHTSSSTSSLHTSSTERVASTFFATWTLQSARETTTALS